MTVVAGQSKRFTDASPVTRYWLANCDGFAVAGAKRGTVERVIAGQLEVRRGRRRCRVPASTVIEIIPAEQTLVVRGSDRRAAQHAAVRRAAVATGILLLGVATWLARAGKELGTVLLRAGLELVRLVRSLPWQQYGRSVRSGTTRLWQEISLTWSRLLTTSSEQSNATRSSERARTTSST